MTKAVSWLISIILALVGFYWIMVELGLKQKTPFLYAGIIFLLPLIITIVSMARK